MYASAILSFVRQFPRECLAALVLILLAAGTALVPPMLLGRFIDALGGGQFVILLGIGYFAASALAGLFESGQDAMIVAVGQRMMHALRSRMAAKLPKLPAAYFDRHEAGGTAALFLKDVDAIDVLFTDGILSLFANSLRIVAILAAILWTSRGLFVLFCVALPVLFLFTRLVQRRVLAAQSANRSAVARIVACIPETLSSFRMIRGFGIEPWMERRYGAMLDDGYHAMDRTNFYDSVYSPIIKSAGAAVVAVMMVLAAGAGPRGFFALSVGDAVAMTAYVLAVFEPLEALGMEIQTIQAAAAALGRIRAFLGEKETSLPSQSPLRVPAPPVGEPLGVPCIEFRDVTFSYEAEKPVLSHLSFSVHPGEHVVLRGRTGAGKTTILRLVAGLYTPQSGEVLVGGKRAADVLPEERRHLYGIAGQASRAPCMRCQQVFQHRWRRRGCPRASAICSVSRAPSSTTRASCCSTNARRISTAGRRPCCSPPSAAWQRAVPCSPSRTAGARRWQRRERSCLVEKNDLTFCSFCAIIRIVAGTQDV